MGDDLGVGWYALALTSTATTALLGKDDVCNEEGGCEEEGEEEEEDEEEEEEEGLLLVCVLLEVGSGMNEGYNGALVSPLGSSFGNNFEEGAGMGGTWGTYSTGDAGEIGAVA